MLVQVMIELEGPPSSSYPSAHANWHLGEFSTWPPGHALDEGPMTPAVVPEATVVMAGHVISTHSSSPPVRVPSSPVTTPFVSQASVELPPL